MSSDWFVSWFDSPYYHILYKNRDDDEARLFIQNLVGHFNIAPYHKVLDLACGKGRHSIFLNTLGVNVLGVDLSGQSIAFAQQYETETLKFAVQDMRQPVANAAFDFVLNLFTSFGYFESEAENLQTIAAIAHSLKSGGIFIIDLFNAEKVLQEITAQQEKTIEGITFNITKKVEGKHIIKNIEFSDQGKTYSFVEKVECFYLDDFQKLLQEAGLKFVASYGNYMLSNFDPQTSDRLIVAARKI